MSSWFCEVARLKLIDLNKLNQEEDRRYRHANYVAYDNSKRVISKEFILKVVSNILVPKHLDKEWNKVASIEHEESLEIPGRIME